MSEARQRRLAHEKLLWRYANALERGDFEIIEKILQEVEADPMLEPMILEINDAIMEEDEAFVQASDIALVRELIQTHLPSAIPDDSEEMEMPPLTVGQIVGELQKEPQLWRQTKHEGAAILERLQQSQEPVPEHLTERGVRQFFERLRLSVSDRFQELFRETAIFLSLGREQGMARMAATRKQRTLRQKSKERRKKEE